MFSSTACVDPIPSIFNKTFLPSFSFTCTTTRFLDSRTDISALRIRKKIKPVVNSSKQKNKEATHRFSFRLCVLRMLNRKINKTMDITPVRAMVPFKYTYKIRVRVSRVWRPRFRRTEKYDGLHYVLVDQNGYSVHALIDEDQHNDMTQTVELGQLYDIYRFSTHQDFRTFRVLQNETVVHFNGSTVFVKINEVSPPVPQHAFRLIELEDLQTERESKEIMADVYGCIKSVKVPHEQPLRNKNKVETKCEITVQNLRYGVCCYLHTGDIARSFDIGTVQRSPPPVLAVFTSLLLAEYNEHVVASNSNHTCVFFNPPIPARGEYMIESCLRILLCAFNPVLKTTFLCLNAIQYINEKVEDNLFSKTGDKVRIIGVISSHQTTKGVEQPNQEKPVFCSASIRRFSPNGWWYRSCSTTGCYRMLQKNEEKDNKHFCPLHGLQNPQPSQAQQLFKNSCQELLEKRFYPTEQSLPEEIVDTVGQAHLFEIKLKPDRGFTVSGIAPSKDAATTTVDLPQTERKRTNESGLTTLSKKEPEKKSRRETAEEASSSSSMTPDKTKIDCISI
ncbi:hypothetical protein ACLB2K_013958 [Fragaria x ananassa]